jgi:transposase-like protein
MSRRRYTDEDKARLLGEFDASRGSAAAFCRQRGLAYQTFISWRRGDRACRRATRSATEFVEFEVGSPRQVQSTAVPLIELDLGGGLVLRIHPHAPRR